MRAKQNNAVIPFPRAEERAERQAEATASTGQPAKPAVASPAPPARRSRFGPTIGEDDREWITSSMGEESRGTLVEEHLWLVDRLVGQTARRFPNHVERNELWSAGVLGLVEAARRYDATLNVPFPAYAAARVRGEMLEAARGADLASRRLRRSLRDLAGVVEQLTQELGRVPNIEEVAVRSHLDSNLVRQRLDDAAALARSSSLDADSGTNAGANALGDPESDPSEILAKQELVGALARSRRRLARAAEVGDRAHPLGQRAPRRHRGRHGDHVPAGRAVPGGGDHRAHCLVLEPLRLRPGPEPDPPRQRSTGRVLFAARRSLHLGRSPRGAPSRDRSPTSTPGLNRPAVRAGDGGGGEPYGAGPSAPGPPGGSARDRWPTSRGSARPG